jgi:AAA ATPase domain
VQETQLGELLGQEVLAARISKDFEGNSTHLVRLTGEAGSGKSFVARQVAETWQAAGGRCVIAIGDDEHAWKELFPLLSGLAHAPPDWAGLARTGGRSAIRVGEVAAGSPGVGTSIFDLLAAGFRQQTERALRSYSELARDVILDLRRIARRRPLLLVCDNAHWWDADSLQLVMEILSEPLREAVSQLQSVSVLMVDTANEQKVVAPDAFEVLAERSSDHTHRIHRCTRDQFPAVLGALGISESLPLQTLDGLFAATNGHLKLAEQIARHENPDLPDDFARLASARFTFLGESGDEIVDLLAGAAILGLSCSEDDLVCVSDFSPPELRALIERAEDGGLVERSADEIAFSHDVVRTAVLGKLSTAHQEGLYLKLAECLAELRPGDYEARAAALLQGKEMVSARDMTALAGVAQLRRGVSPAKVLRRADRRFPDDADLHDFLRLIADGYAAIAGGDFEIVSKLRSQSGSETLAMAAERNYLAAICLIGLQTELGRAEARSILSLWAPEVRAELELELRFLVLLQQAQVLSDEFEQARKTEIEIEQRLSRRCNCDLDANVLGQVQNRRAGGLMAPEFAKDRIARAVSFFEQGTGEHRRDQLELFRSLTNLAAIKIRLDENRSAYGHALRAERVAVESLDAGHRVDVLANNLTLAGYRAGEINLDAAIGNQWLIIDGPEASTDNFIQRCNLTAFLLLANRDDDAFSQLSVLENEVDDLGFDESYLVYYSSALAVAAAAVTGNIKEALERHGRLERFVSVCRWPTASYLKRRQRMLGELLPTLDPERPRAQLDRLLIDSGPRQVGRAWAYYARLIPCCELSFWADS